MNSIYLIEKLKYHLDLLESSTYLEDIGDQIRKNLEIYFKNRIKIENWHSFIKYGNPSRLVINSESSIGFPTIVKMYLYEKYSTIEISIESEGNSPLEDITYSFRVNHVSDPLKTKSLIIDKTTKWIVNNWKNFIISKKSKPLLSIDKVKDFIYRRAGSTAYADILYAALKPTLLSNKDRLIPPPYNYIKPFLIQLIKDEASYNKNHLNISYEKALQTLFNSKEASIYDLDTLEDLIDSIIDDILIDVGSGPLSSATSDDRDISHFLIEKGYTDSLLDYLHQIVKQNSKNLLKAALK